jgi:FKBP-type peptidyl-prolyl cis-trans isomerase (trigger factor)
MDALVSKAELDLPNASVQSEVERMVESARADLKQRGIKDADKAPIPDDVFRPQAERRVRLGLVVAELVRANNCMPSPSRSRPTWKSWPPATKSPLTWCAGTTATTAAWPKSKPW